jgi:hypothetical protein
MKKQWLATLIGPASYRTKDREYVRGRTIRVTDPKEAALLKTRAEFSVEEIAEDDAPIAEDLEDEDAEVGEDASNDSAIGEEGEGGAEATGDGPPAAAPSAPEKPAKKVASKKGAKKS